VSDDLLTTAEAARLAGVGASSVKRWADLELLPCVRTAGGHRRFHRHELERFLRELAHEPAGDAHAWVDALLAEGVFALHGELLRARERLGSWHEVAEELGPALRELGARWAQGRISVLEEHVASEKLSRALERAAESIPSSPLDPQALLATADGEEHTLGLSLVELCLREAGFACTWSGRGTPTSDLVARVESGELALLALSASAASTNAARLRRQVETLGPVCREHGVRLVLGGSGAWPDPLVFGERLRGLTEVFTAARGWRKDVTRGRSPHADKRLRSPEM